MANIWGRKPIAVLQAEAKEGEFGSVPGEPRLRRTLSLASLIALGIGCIIGAGIFVLTGNAAAAHAGPAVSLSFILAGLVSTFAGLCYAEMASTVPVAGSAYTYAYATMGEFVAWVIGWDLILEYAFGATTVAIGWSGYLTSLLRDLGLVIPAKFASAPLAYDPAVGTWSPTDALVNLPGQKWLFRHLDTRRARLRAVANGLPDKTTSPYNNYLCRTDERAWIARSSLPPIM